ncbi:MAG: hypothetical protein IIZ19_10100 [Clostridia bacterium]|nr:hypothetical protein [Clostridia bacterium]
MKHLITIALTFALLVGITAGCASTDTNKTEVNKEDTAPLPEEELVEQSVSNGQIIKASVSTREAPFGVTVVGEDGYYIYLENISDRSDDISFYVAPSSNAEIDVPLGTYKMYYCCGSTWYGPKDKFGYNTDFYEAEGTFRFYQDDEYVYGHTVELYEQENGNLETDYIPASEFPG